MSIHTQRFTRDLPFHVPDIGEEEIQAVAATLRSGWLTTGARVQEFEDLFATQIGCRYAVAVNSCTASLHLALEAIGLQEGDEVIVPTMTFTATAAVVTYFKATPVLVDICEDTFNIDVQKVEQAITPRTKAIIPVHFAGHPCEMDRILEIAHSHQIKVIEDAAHALPARYQGKMVGTLGDISCFSFYATKNITTGEGGMATTNNPEWANRMRMMSLHGMSRDAWKRYEAQGSWYYEVASPGYKYNLTDLAAAIGIPQLRRCAGFWQRREAYAALYSQGFHDVPEIRIPFAQNDVQHSWHLYVIQLEVDRLRLDRAQFIDLLTKQRIGTSVHFIPLHLHPWYRDHLGCVSEDFPIASRVYERIVSLPLYPKMTPADVEYVIDVVKDIVKEYKR